MAELVIVVLVVVLISATCSVFEAVLYSIPISHIESLVHSGKASGRTLRKLREQIDRPISAILSLNTIANTGGASLAGAFAVSYFGTGTLATEYIFPTFFTLVILLFSEVIPKTIGVAFARPLSIIIARPLQLLVWVLTPSIVLCRMATRLVAKGQKEQDMSGEELISLASGAVAVCSIQLKPTSFKTFCRLKRKPLPKS